MEYDFYYDPHCYWDHQDIEDQAKRCYKDYMLDNPDSKISEEEYHIIYFSGYIGAMVDYQCKEKPE